MTAREWIKRPVATKRWALYFHESGSMDIAAHGTTRWAARRWRDYYGKRAVLIRVTVTEEAPR